MPGVPETLPVAYVVETGGELGPAAARLDNKA